jgi:glucose/arabinose dehydrogenase
MRRTALVCLVALLAMPAVAQNVVTSEKANFRIVRLADGLENPWSLAFLPDGGMLVTERPGRLRAVASDGRLSATPVTGVPEVFARGQGGLFDVVLHPRFAENRTVFLSYAAPAEGGAVTRVARARYADGALADLQPIFNSAAPAPGAMHFGGRLAFGADGRLYLTTGDRRDDMRSQRPDDLNGKLVRIDENGRVPADNPFVGRAGWRPEIYAYGLRNSQGLAVDGTGRIWAVDHGAQGGDELNLLRAGLDYGWPVVTHSRNYGIGTRIGEATSRSGVEDGITLWTPSIAPSGLAFYRGAAFPGWAGSVFVGALAGRALHRLEIADGRVTREEKLLADLGHRIRDVRVDAQGRLHLLTDSRNGFLLRLEPAGN